MKKVIFSIEGRRFDVELDNSFAEYVEKDLFNNNISSERACDSIKLLQLYLKSMKKNFNNEEQIKSFMDKHSLD